MLSIQEQLIVKARDCWDLSLQGGDQFPQGGWKCCPLGKEPPVYPSCAGLAIFGPTEYRLENGGRTMVLWV